MRRSSLTRCLVWVMALSACKTTSPRSNVKESTGVSGRKKALFEGYNDNSKQYVNRICIVPAFALDPNTKRIKTEYLMPEVFSMVDGTDLNKLVKAAGDSATAMGLQINPLKINSYSGSDQEATLEYIKDAGSSDLLDKVAGGLDVNMNFAGGSASGGAQVALENGKTSRSLSQMLLLKLRGQSVQVDPESAGAKWALTEYGQQVQASVAKILDPTQRLQYIAQNCGTSYVSQVQFGATFIASMKIIGKMESDLNYIHGQLNVKTVGASGSGEVTIDNKKLSSDVKVNLSIYQRGGDPVSLAGIFGNLSGDAKPVADDLEKSRAASKLVNCDTLTIGNCLEVFFRLVEYGTGGLPLDVNPEKPKEGSKAISPKLAEQISDLTRSGYSVTGYEVERYTQDDFISAGMIPADGAGGMQLKAKKAPAKTKKSLKLANTAVETNAKGKKLLPLSERIKQMALERRLRSLIDIWTFAKEARQVVNDPTNRFNLSEVETELLSQIASIQQVFEICGSGSVTECETKTETLLKAMEDPAKTIAYIGEVNKVIESELKTANFYDYCVLTGVRRFQDNQETDWRNSMQLLATRVLSPDVKIEGQSILTWKLESSAADSILAAQKAGTAISDATGSTKMAAMQDFCKALYNAPPTDYLNFTFDNNENKSLLVEPLKYFKGIKTLVITGGSTSSDIVKNVALLPDLRDLTIRRAMIADPLGIAQMPFLQVLTLEGVQTAQTQGSSFLADTTREALRNKSLTRLIIKPSADAPVDTIINLDEFPIAFNKGVFSNRFMFQVSIQSNSQIQLDNVEKFFGFAEEDGQCVDKLKLQDMVRWAGREQLELDIKQWTLGCFSNCVDKVVARCLQFQKASKASTKLQCDLSC